MLRDTHSHPTKNNVCLVFVTVMQLEQTQSPKSPRAFSGLSFWALYHLLTQTTGRAELTALIKAPSTSKLDTTREKYGEGTADASHAALYVVGRSLQTTTQGPQWNNGLHACKSIKEKLEDKLERLSSVGSPSDVLLTAGAV